MKVHKRNGTERNDTCRAKTNGKAAENKKRTKRKIPFYETKQQDIGNITVLKAGDLVSCSHVYVMHSMSVVNVVSIDVHGFFKYLCMGFIGCWVISPFFLSIYGWYAIYTMVSYFGQLLPDGNENS